MARYEFKLPDIGEGIAEAEIVAWHVKVGDNVAEDQQIADMMTDKATVEMESPVAGKVLEVAGEVFHDGEGEHVVLDGGGAVDAPLAVGVGLGELTLAEVDGRPIAVFLVDGSFYAIDDVCTHDGGPLGEGQLEGFAIACPRHGAKFDVRDGRALTMPATKATVTHDVKVVGEDVLVRLRD